MPRLSGDRIMLREYKREDLPHIREWVNDPEVVDNLSDIFLVPHTLDATEEFIDSVLKGKGPTPYCFVIADKVTEDYIGQVDLINVDWKNRTAEIGIVIGEDSNRGKGIGTEALQLIQEYVFNRLNLNRLQLRVHSYNTRAHRCYLQCGFKEEGRLRQGFYIHGQYFDILYLSILRSEFDSRMKARPIV